MCEKTNHQPILNLTMYKRTETQLELNKYKNMLTYHLSQPTLRDKTKITELKRKIRKLEKDNRKEILKRKIDKLETKLNEYKFELRLLTKRKKL